MMVIQVTNLYLLFDVIGINSIFKNVILKVVLPTVSLTMYKNK